MKDGLGLLVRHKRAKLGLIGSCALIQGALSLKSDRLGFKSRLHRFASL